MKFVCDVHISFKVVTFLQQAGHQAVHVNSILSGSHSTDQSIMEYADHNDMIVITKDTDFKNTFHLLSKPKKLIKVSLGNISTELLIELLEINLNDIDNLSQFKSFCVEIGTNNTTVIISG